MAYCSNCGRQLSENMHFCFNCGATINNTAYLEVLVEEVEDLIDEGKYDAARIKASKIVDDTGWSSESEEKWDDIRETLLNIIDKKEKADKKK